MQYIPAEALQDVLEFFDLEEQWLVDFLKERGDMIQPQDGFTLLSLVQFTNAKVVVEIGGRSGGSSTSLLEIAVKKSDGMLYSIQVQGEHNTNSEHVVEITGKSPWVGHTFLQGNKIDLLFIDGDHSVNGVLADYFYYYEFVRHGGFIVFHDINRARQGRQVKKAIEIILDTANDLVEVGRVEQIHSGGSAIFQVDKGGK